MPYNATSWEDNTTLINQTRMNNLETQFAQSVSSINSDLFSSFVLSGFVASKDGTIANQLNVTSGVAYTRQPLGGTNELNRIATNATTFSTSTPSTTYYLVLCNDGTWQWSTSNSGPYGCLFICSVTTDGSGNISTVADSRLLLTVLFPSMSSGTIFFPANIGVTGQATLNLAVVVHIYASGGAPSATAGTNAGTSPPSPIVASNSADAAGSVSFGTGTGAVAGQQVNVTFHSVYSNPNILVCPRNAATAALGLYVYSQSSAGFVLGCANAPTSSQPNTTYSFNYMVMDY